jgi:hypothetical protein
MKLQELLTNIKNEEFNIEQSLEIKKYLPMEVKKTIAQAIIYDCTDEEEGAFTVDSVQRYMSYVRYMISTHTNLEYTDNDYDVLCSTEYENSTLLNAIMDCFGEDAKECSRILNLMMDDLMQKMSVEFSIAKFLNGLNEVVRGFSKKIDDIDLQSIIPNNVDMSKLGAFLQNYIK